MGAKKSKFKGIKVTPTEHKFIERKANGAGVKWSTYVREVALGNISQDEADFSKYDQTEALHKLQKELLHIGTNINQMARVANTNGNINGERLKQIKNELGLVNKQILDAII